MSLGVKLSEVLTFTRGQWLGKSTSNLVFTGVSTDSRSIEPGELFVALKGQNFDGADYIDQAIQNGAKGVITDRSGVSAPSLILVNNSLKALGDLARYVRRRLGLRVLAITGSVGKTTVKEMAKNILKAKNRLMDPIRKDPVRDILATEGNLNNEIGLPLTILSLIKMELPPVEAVLEMGAAKPGDISYLASIARPEVGLITAIGQAHLEGFRDLATVAKTKAELFRSLGGDGLAVANKSETCLREELKDSLAKIMYFGPGGQVWLKKIQATDLFKQKLTFGGASVADMEVEIAWPGEHNAINALAATAASLAMGCGQMEIKEGLAKTPNMPGRLNPLKSPKGFWVLDDSYNANPTSVRASLKLLDELPVKGQKAVILGDMLELGPDSPSFHQEIGALVASLGLDFLMVVGSEANRVINGVLSVNQGRLAALSFDNPIEAADWLLERGENLEAILVKGSRAVKLERAVARLMEA
ncbi:MAG: UDP-N-acetylmuramoyl-tripeptide--D-alanyl-D-alanine ligase [Deltaproteobacteria bacterium]|jgi:UDP-N-acetylmuramoyl-tripeptide--D-alanyl-D-alanine ligase|nr:UDP-N-acetylmuramoyl-tripeptide--D-alanyl-D-alanine ligase [Deltaproteobacteria bacterium]